MARSVSVSDVPMPERLQRTNTGVYNMARIRRVMALDDAAREKLAQLISEDMDAFDLPGAMNDFDANELMEDTPEAREAAFMAWVDEDFIQAVADDRDSALKAIEEVKAWLLPQCEALVRSESESDGLAMGSKRRSV